MKKSILSGLILLLPVTITVAVFLFLVDFLTTPFLGSMESLLQFLTRNFAIDIHYHATALVIISRILILILLFFFVMLLGFLGKRILFHWIVKSLHAIMLRIPIIKSIYKMCRDIIEALLSENKKIFSRVVTIPFPSSSSRAVGFVTGNAPKEVQNSDISDSPQTVLKTVFVPTSPHPISGFLLISEEKHLRQQDFSIEDAFKFLISCGIFNPDQKSNDPENGADDDTKNPKNNILPGK